MANQYLRIGGYFSGQRTAVTWYDIQRFVLGSVLTHHSGDGSTCFGLRSHGGCDCSRATHVSSRISLQTHHTLRLPSDAFGDSRCFRYSNSRMLRTRACLSQCNMRDRCARDSIIDSSLNVATNAFQYREAG